MPTPQASGRMLTGRRTVSARGLGAAGTEQAPLMGRLLGTGRESRMPPSPTGPQGPRCEHWSSPERAVGSDAPHANISVIRFHNQPGSCRAEKGA